MHFKCYFNLHFLKLLYKAIPSSSSGWICFKLDQRVPRHYISANYNLDHPIWRSVAGGTAGSVKFDGPSVPSEDCCSSCSSTTGAIPLLFVYSSCPCTIPQCLTSFNLGSSLKGRRRPQKGKDSSLVCIWGTSTHGGGVTKVGTLWKWIFRELWWFFWDFSIISLLPTAGLPSLCSSPFSLQLELLTKIT